MGKITKSQYEFINKLNEKYYCDLEPTDNKKEDVLKPSFYDRTGLIKILPKFMLSRTEMCQHKSNISCSENVLHSFFITFINMLSIKLVANNVFYLGNLKKLIKNLTNYKSNKDNLMFALFLALINCTYKYILCTMRRFVKNDKINALIAGFLAG